MAIGGFAPIIEAVLLFDRVVYGLKFAHKIIPVRWRQKGCIRDLSLSPLVPQDSSSAIIPLLPSIKLPLSDHSARWAKARWARNTQFPSQNFVRAVRDIPPYLQASQWANPERSHA